MRDHPTVRGFGPLVAVIAGWGTIPVLVRQVDLPAFAIVSARVWLAALALSLVVVWERSAGRVSGPRLLSVQRSRCVAVSVILAVHWSALFAAYQRAPIGTVIFIVYLAPIGIALAAPRVLGERATPRVYGALALAVGGFSLLAGRAVDAAGGAGLVLSAIAAATFVLLVLWSTPLAAEYGGVRAALIEMVGAGVLLLPLALRAEWGAPRVAWTWLLVIGVVHTAAALAIYLNALARVGATNTGILGYLEPVSATFFAWVFLAEGPAMVSIFGGVAIIAAGALVLTDQRTNTEVPVHVPG